MRNLPRLAWTVRNAAQTLRRLSLAPQIGADKDICEELFRERRAICAVCRNRHTRCASPPDRMGATVAPGRSGRFPFSSAGRRCRIGNGRGHDAPFADEPRAFRRRIYGYFDLAHLSAEDYRKNKRISTSRNRREWLSKESSLRPTVVMLRLCRPPEGRALMVWSHRGLGRWGRLRSLWKDIQQPATPRTKCRLRAVAPFWYGNTSAADSAWMGR